MQIAKRPLSKHRRARLIAWTLAMLMWMASVLFAGAPFTDRHERQRRTLMSLDRLKRQVLMLIVSRAGDFVSRRPRRLIYRRRGVSLLRRGLFRKMIGAQLRKVLKRKGIGERIAVLIDAIRNLDRYAALLAKRLQRGLRKLWGIAPSLVAAETLASLATVQAPLADSS